MKVLLLSRYSRLGASSRLRSLQYLPYLEQAGMTVEVAPLFGDDYVSGLSTGNISKLAVIKAYWRRLCFIRKARQFDVVWLEYEALPWLPAWFELALLPKRVGLVVDYDDAIFHRYDQHRSALVRKLMGHKIDAVMRRANVVMVGNGYLGARAQQAGASRVELIPTVVDSTRYSVLDKADDAMLTIGWIGQPSTAKYLAQLAPVLQRLAERYALRVVAVGPQAQQFAHMDVEVRPWTENSEVAEIQQFDIGVMPLTDSLWERGKCGYKLIQYMACGKPVVATPVGVNSVIVQQGVNGFLASTEQEWFEALDALCSDAVLRKRMGDAGRARMEKHYSLQVTAPQLIELFSAVEKS